MEVFLPVGPFGTCSSTGQTVQGSVFKYKTGVTTDRPSGAPLTPSRSISSVGLTSATIPSYNGMYTQLPIGFQHPLLGS